MDRLTAARVFIEVAERASLTRAAERLDMSTAMVSRYLAAAEQWLGARLLHRTTRRVSLTDAGQAALASCRQLLDVAEDLQHRARDLSSTPAGKLRITTSASFAEAQLAAALVEFQRSYPKVNIELLVADRALDLVEDRIDLAVRITNALDPNLVSRPLALCRSVVCASPTYLAEHGQPSTVDDLRTHACIGHTFGSGTTYRLTRAGRAVAIDVSGTLVTNQTTILRRAVLAGAGIGMLPTYFIAEQLHRGELVRLLPDYEPEVLGIHAVYLSRRHQPLALRLMVDFLVEHFSAECERWDTPTLRRVSTVRAHRRGGHPSAGRTLGD